MSSLARGNPRGGNRSRASQTGQHSNRGSGGVKGSTASPFQKATRGRGQGLAGRGALQTASHQSIRKSKLSVVQNAKGNWMERYTALQDSRKKEREDAIRRGLMADPDKPTTLAEAITLVGTCQDMCAEFERVERVVQKDVWKEEVDPSRTAVNPLDREPDETRMVKKFRRAAAGIEEQLPSDLRPPTVLQQTCDYLFNDIIGAADTLAAVHHFVWDRTRAIRNDFSIQQLTRSEDLAIAVNCYEQIARFHILSLHQLALAEKPYEKYDWQQEREQLDRTLLSLIQYYDDSRGKVDLVNEPEFRAYCVIFQLRNPDPDLEEKVQTWPHHISNHQRVRSALKLYAAACNTRDDFGPLKPAVPHATAQQDWHRVWQLIESNEISYLTACVAEIHFNMVRENVLHALLRSTSIKNMIQWTLEELRIMLAFDTEDGIVEFCARYDLSFTARNGVLYLDFSGLKNKSLPAANANATKQLKTGIVEQKRAGRSLPAVISGLTFKQALDRGMVNHEEDADMDGAMDDHDMDVAQDSDDGLFVSESKPTNPTSAFAGFLTPDTPQADKPASISAAPAPKQAPTSGFGKPSPSMDPTANSFTPKFSFSKPSSGTATPSLFSTIPSTSSTSTFGMASPGITTQATTAPSVLAGAQTAAIKKPAFDFTAGLNKINETISKPSTSPFAGFVKPAATTPSPSTTTTIDTNSTANESVFSFLNKPAIGASSGNSTAKSNSLFSQPQPEAPQGLSKPNINNTESSIPPTSSLFDFAKSSAPSTTSGLFSSAAPATNESMPEKPSKIAETPLFNFSKPTTNTPASLPQPTAPSLFTAPAASPSIAPATTTTSMQLFSVPNDEPPAKQSSVSPAAPVSPKSFPSVTQLEPVQQPAQKQATPTAPVIDLNSIVIRLAEELSYEPQSGFFKQYVDFALGQIVLGAQEKVYNERLEQDAKLFRAHVLTLRYGRRWRELYRAKKHAKHARDRRARAMKRLNDHKSQTSAASSTVGDESIMGEERLRRPAPPTTTAAKRAAMDKLFQKTSGQWAKDAAEKASSNGARSPSMTHNTSPDAAQQRQSTRVLRIDRSGKVVKPSPLRASHGSTSDHSSFSPARSTTKSSYFRLKALGMDKVDQSIAKSRKRGFSELSDGASEQSWSSPSNPLLLPANIVTPSETPEERDAKMLKLHDEEDELFARLRAARANLEEGMSFYKAEVAKSLSPQTEPVATGHYDSPSLQRARQEARWRHENKKLPAYMLRESKFVRPTLPSTSHTPHSAARSHDGTPSAVQTGHSSPAIGSIGGHQETPSARQDTNTSHTFQQDESQTIVADSYTNGAQVPSQEHPDQSMQSVNAHVDEPASGIISHVPSDSGVHDYTIKQSQVIDSLNASFGPPPGQEHSPPLHHSFGDSTWTDDADIMPQSGLDEPMQHMEEPYANGDVYANGFSASPYDVASQNPFALLEKHSAAQSHAEEGSTSEDEGDEFVNGRPGESDYDKLYAEVDDADISDDEEDEGADSASQEYGYHDEAQYDEGDEDGLDSEEGESDEDEPPAAHEALKTVGRTEDDAIELSD